LGTAAAWNRRDELGGRALEGRKGRNHRKAEMEGQKRNQSGSPYKIAANT
jgi:hypothetical protein